MILIPNNHDQCSKLNVVTDPYTRTCIQACLKGIKGQGKRQPKVWLQSLDFAIEPRNQGASQRSKAMRWNPGRQLPGCAKQGYVWSGQRVRGCRMRMWMWRGGIASSGRQSWQPQIIIDISKISLHCSAVQSNLRKVAGGLPSFCSPANPTVDPPSISRYFPLHSGKMRKLKLGYSVGLETNVMSGTWWIHLGKKDLFIWY